MIVATKQAIKKDDPDKQRVLILNNFFPDGESAPLLVVTPPHGKILNIICYFIKKIMGEMILWIGG